MEDDKDMKLNNIPEGDGPEELTPEDHKLGRAASSVSQKYLFC